MDPDDRSVFRLSKGLGGQSKSVYQSIIKKVYGKESANDVIAALHENPAVAVPVVLARLKQKAEEWKKSLREWNRVWREVDFKNHYKALDHMGLSIKTADKKAISQRALVTEIETIRKEQLQRRIEDGQSAPQATRFQLSFKLDEMEIFFDAVKVVLSYMEHAPGGLSESDKAKIQAFFSSFISVFFDMSPVAVDACLSPAPDEDGDHDTDNDGASDAGGSVADDTPLDAPATAGGKRRRGGGGGDLRKRALRNAGGGSRKREGGGGRNSKASSPAPASPAPAPSDAEDSMDVDKETGNVSPVPSEVEKMEKIEVDVPPPTPMEVDVPPPIPAESTALPTSPTSSAEAPAPPTSEPPVATVPAAISADPSSSNITDKVPSVSKRATSEQPAPRKPKFALKGTNALPFLEGDAARKRLNFFCNTNFYHIVRVLQVCHILPGDYCFVR